MSEKKYPTTEKDFDLFKSEFMYWVNVWGLKDWEVVFRHEVLEDARACIYVDESGRIATVFLNTKYVNPFDDDEIRRVAFHEARELFYGLLTKAAKNRYATEDQITEAVHACIRIDENTIWKDYMHKLGVNHA